MSVSNERKNVLVRKGGGVKYLTNRLYSSFCKKISGNVVISCLHEIATCLIVLHYNSNFFLFVYLNNNVIIYNESIT